MPTIVRRCLMSHLEPPISQGRYRHFKGGEYEVIGVAMHSETQEWMVVYRPLYGEQGLWVRPLEMFAERVSVAGEEVPRFAFLGPMTHTPTVSQEALPE
jgi:hypothetical protein